MQQQSITMAPFPNSKKVYLPGQLFPIKVAMREIALHPTKRSNGSLEENPPVTVYDTSGPYTDETANIDVRKGIDRIREQWILDRADVDILESITSEYGKARLADQSLDHLRFAYCHKPMVAKEGKNVTQLYYARQGIITPEMEYIAIRENQKIEQLETAGTAMQAQHLKNGAKLNLCAKKLPQAGPLSLIISITRKVNR